MKNYKYKSLVYKEESHLKDPFLTERIFIKGYDLNEELIPKIDFIDWLGVTFFNEKPTEEIKNIISKLPMLISNKGFKDPGVLSSSMASATNNPDQNSLIAMISTSGGLYKGSKEINILVNIFYKLNKKNKLYNINNISKEILNLKEKEIEAYGKISHLLGFNEWQNEESSRIKNILNYFSSYESLKLLNFIKDNKTDLENKVNQKIDLELLISAIFYDIKIDPDSIEFFYFFLFIPFVNMIKNEQKKIRSFPFYQDLFEDKNEL